MSQLFSLWDNEKYLIDKKEIYYAASFMQEKLPYLERTPLVHSKGISEFIAATFGVDCRVHLKREDLQPNRSFKGRGAGYNIARCVERGVNRLVCASAGNHSQGVAMAVTHFGVEGIIFMPRHTPLTKVIRTLSFGGKEVNIEEIEAIAKTTLDHVILHNGPVTLELVGESFDDACQLASSHAKEIQAAFIHPFDDRDTIIGQGTIALEIMDQAEEQQFNPSMILAAVGGGGLVAGMVSFLQERLADTDVVGVEAKEAAAMVYALLSGPGELTPLAKIDATVDGAAVKCAGERTSAILSHHRTAVMTVDNRQIEYGFQKLHDYDIVAELAGVLPFAALCRLAQENRIEANSDVVIVLSGANIDPLRVERIIKTAPKEFPIDDYPLDFDPHRPFLERHHQAVRMKEEA